jgi:hypothetical protein
MEFDVVVYHRIEDSATGEAKPVAEWTEAELARAGELLFEELEEALRVPFTVITDGSDAIEEASSGERGAASYRIAVEPERLLDHIEWQQDFSVDAERCTVMSWGVGATGFLIEGEVFVRPSSTRAAASVIAEHTPFLNLTVLTLMPLADDEDDTEAQWCSFTVEASLLSFLLTVSTRQRLCLAIVDEQASVDVRAPF